MSDQWSPWALTQYQAKYEKDGEGWWGTAHRTVTNVLGAAGYDADSHETKALIDLVGNREFIPGGRYLYAAGRDFHQTQNCLLMRADDSQEGWADLNYRVTMGLMTGAGVGVEYSAVRPKGSPLSRKGGSASGPISLMHMVNEIGRHVMQGGSRRSAIWAGLVWDHPDVFDFVRAKDWLPEVRALKEKDFDFPAALDKTNISVRLNAEFFEAYDDENHPKHDWAHNVYWLVVRRMLKTGEPGFSVDLDDQILRNACTEVISATDNDICNLGSINLARVRTLDQMEHAAYYATLFLLCGTLYSHVPYDSVDLVRASNRRLGCGVMGVHEWLALNGKSYGPDRELGTLLQLWAGTMDREARTWADAIGVNVPIATRAIAPTGTIGIIGETTTGIEPIFCVAYKRRYLVDGDTWAYQYVVDPTAKRLVDKGVDPNQIEDAYSLAQNPERRVGFQAWMQQYVDQGISSTINLPHVVTDPDEVRAFGEMLIDYLPRLRGITAYPDGARGGQPLTPVPYEEAIAQEGVVFIENEDKCVGGVCGI